MLKYKKYTYVIMQETGDTHTKSGEWNFEFLKNDDKTTTLTITETRLIPEILSRVINHFLHTSTEKIDTYFNSINNKIIGDDIRAKEEEITTPQK